jgi:hypothetical protein
MTTSSQSPPLVEEEAHFKTLENLEKNKNTVMGLDETPNQDLLC